MIYFRLSEIHLKGWASLGTSLSLRIDVTCVSAYDCVCVCFLKSHAYFVSASNIRCFWNHGFSHGLQPVAMLYIYIYIDIYIYTKTSRGKKNNIYIYIVIYIYKKMCENERGT